MSLKLIATTTVGSGGAANITFSSIPQTYTDLMLVVSVRQSTGGDGYISFNSSTSNFSRRDLYATGSSAASSSASDNYIGNIGDSTYTANTFSSNQIYIPNYAGNIAKSYSVESLNENNATVAYMRILAGLWDNTAAITSIALSPATGNLIQHSSASLYGITKGSDGIVTTS